MTMVKLLSIIALTVSLGAGELHDAVKALDGKKITQLLKEGADINATDKAGETPLHIASRIGRLSVVKMLLSHNPDLYSENNKGYTPLAIAISRNHIKTINTLLKAQKRQNDALHLPLLHSAVMDNDIKSVKFFLKRRYEVDITNDDGMTPLHLAAKNGLADIVELLIEHGADVYASDNEGRDVLYYARYGNNENVIKQITDERTKRAKK